MTEELNNAAIGSSVEDFLKEEGVYEDCYTEAVKEVLEWHIKQLRQEGEIKQGRNGRADVNQPCGT